MPVLIWMIIFSVHCSFAQVDNIVTPSRILTDVHKNNIGRIVFTATFVNTDTISTEDFLTACKFTNKSDLFFTAFLGNSATNYLHGLAPNLPADELNMKGNYQFAFYIDGHHVHTSNLITGAPQAAVQDSATLISKPFIDNKRENSIWSQSLWNRFMYYGGDSALTEGKHLLRIELRVYIDTGKVLTSKLIASGDLPLIVNRKPTIDIAKIRLHKPAPYNGFHVSNDAFDTAGIKRLIANIHENVFRNITSIVVIKNSKLLIEEYFNGADRNTLHDTRSVGKSFSSTFMGMAVRDGLIQDESVPLKAFYSLKDYKNYSPAKDSVTIKQLLTMSAGFDGDDSDPQSPGNEENMYPTNDWVRFTLDLPVNNSRPKASWHYFTAGVILLGDILNKKLPGGLGQYARTNFFLPLGITRYQWQYTPQHVPNTAGSLQLNTLDLAKYGQLYKNNGVWNGQQLVPAQWVKKTFTHQLPVTNRNGEYYGYLFWNRSFEVNGKSYEAYYCAGNGGNSVFIFKDLPLVIVVTAKAYGAYYAHDQVNKIVTGYLLPSVIR